MRVEFAKGSRVDMRVMDLESLEVDGNALVRGNLTVNGTEIVNLTEIHKADVQIRNGYSLILYSDDGVTETGRLNASNGKATFTSVAVGDLLLKYGWRLYEGEDGLYLEKDGRKFKLVMEVV